MLRQLMKDKDYTIHLMRANDAGDPTGSVTTVHAVSYRAGDIPILPPIATEGRYSVLVSFAGLVDAARFESVDIQPDQLPTRFFIDPHGRLRHT